MDLVQTVEAEKQRSLPCVHGRTCLRPRRALPERDIRSEPSWGTSSGPGTSRNPTTRRCQLALLLLPPATPSGGQACRASWRAELLCHGLLPTWDSPDAPCKMSPVCPSCHCPWRSGLLSFPGGLS